MMIYQNREKPWKHICTRITRFEKQMFFSFKWVPNNKLMSRPRFHAMINLFILSFWRDNLKTCIGIGLGKTQWQLVISG